MKTGKTKVCFDTSYLIYLIDHPHLQTDNPYFHKEEFECAITIEVLQELFFGREGDPYKYDDNKKCKKLELVRNCHFIENNYRLLLREVMGDENSSFYISPQHREYIIESLEGSDNPEENHFLKESGQIIKENRKVFEEQFQSFCKSYKKISYGDILQEINVALNSNLPLKIPPITGSEGKIRVPFSLEFTIKKTGLGIEISQYTEHKFNFIKYNGFEGFKQKLPSLYNILVFNQFTEKLIGPQSTNKKNNSFKINIPFGSETNEIKINRNLLPDFRIIINALECMDILVTCDEGFARLIKGLYPHHFNKVHFYKEYTANGIMTLKRQNL